MKKKKKCNSNLAKNILVKGKRQFKISNVAVVMLRDKTKENNTVLVLKEYIKDKEKVSRMFGSEGLLFESRSSEYHLRACNCFPFQRHNATFRSDQP